MTQWLVYSDLDGTLLDHHDYGFKPAEPLLAQLKQDGVPVIPNTSKTFEELLPLRLALQLDTPFIVENGAAVAIPKGYFSTLPAGLELRDGFFIKSFVPRRSHWVSLLKSFGQFSHCYQSFYNLTPKSLGKLTGLSYEQAESALNRDYSEPMLWTGSDLEKTLFIRTLTAAGATVLEGGRFMHVSGRSDKGKAMNWLTRLYRRNFPNAQLQTVALGDGNNDVAMLQDADAAVAILSASGRYPTLEHKQATYSKSPGPSGWAECLSLLLYPTLTYKP